MRGGRTSRTGPAADAPTSRDDSTSRHTRTRFEPPTPTRLARSPAESAHIRVASTRTTRTTRPNPRTRVRGPNPTSTPPPSRGDFPLKRRRRIRQIHRRAALRAARHAAAANRPTRRRAVQPARNVPHHPNPRNPNPDAEEPRTTTTSTRVERSHRRARPHRGRRSGEGRRDRKVQREGRRARAAAEARWNAVNTTAEAARREYGTPAGPTGGTVRGGGEDENKGSRSPTQRIV